MLLSESFPEVFDLNVLDCRVIAGKIPDFIHRTLPIVVELFGDYWHGKEKTGRSRAKEESVRIEHFRLFGYRAVIIWEHELRDAELIRARISESIQQ